MSKYLIVYFAGPDDGTAYVVVEGNNLMEAICNMDMEKSEDYFQMYYEAIHSEAPTLTNAEIGQVIFYDLFINEQEEFPVVLYVFDLSNNDVRELTQSEIEESWELRPGAETFTSEDIEKRNHEKTSQQQINSEDSTTEI